MIYLKLLYAGLNVAKVHLRLCLYLFRGTFLHTVFSQLNARPWRLFQNWPCGPGVYLKPAFNRGPAFITEVHFSVILSY